MRTFHSSWLLLWTSVGVIVGTTLSLQTTSFTTVGWIVCALMLLLFGFVNRTPFGVVLVLGSGVLLGLYNGGNQLIVQSDVAGLIGSEVELGGRVIEDPTYDAEGDLRFRLKDIFIDGQSYAGELWVGTQQQRIPIKRSDDVVVRGELSKGFGTIPVAMFQADITQLVRQDFADVARDTRDWFADGIREGVREPEASLGSGFLLGQKTALPEKLDNELRLLGLTHIVVASGYNLSILVRYGRRVFSKISRFTGVVLSGAMVYGFANITGFSPSMSRAALITGLSLLAWYYGRKIHPLVLLTVSAGITVLINPTYAWGDIGWLLSFTSFVGVIMLAPLIHAYFWGDEKPSTIRQVFIETMSAQLLTLPIIAFVFGQYSPLALIANLLILPLIPWAMLLTFIGGLAGVIGFIPSIVAWPAETLLGYMTVVVDWLARRPLADSSVEFSVEMVIAMYAGLLCMMVYLWRRTGYEFREYNVIE